MAAKIGITWPDKQEHSSSIAAVLKQHNVAESAKIGHKMAERTKSMNGFDWPLMRSQLLTAEKTSGQWQDLSVETQSGKQPCELSKRMAASAKRLAALKKKG